MTQPVATNDMEAPRGKLVLERGDQGWLLSGAVYVADKPGELADVSAHVAAHQANIEWFRFNRSQDPHTVDIGCRCENGAKAGALAEALADAGRLHWPDKRHEEPTVTDPGGLLQIKLSLENRPGTLAEVSALLRDQQANVIYVQYDVALAPNHVHITIATASTNHVRTFLDALNNGGYHYHVEWQGAELAGVDEIIGLNVVESFLFQLRAVLPKDKIDHLGALIESSAELKQSLHDFMRQAGRDDASMAAGEVFSNVLRLAAASLNRTGHNFSLRLTGPIRVTDSVRMYMLTCPTGCNSFLLRGVSGDVLIDSGYGLYFPDVVSWLSGHAIDPSGIRTALFTHADADHAGWAAFLEKEYQTKIYMHPDCVPVLENVNRAYGVDDDLTKLNGLYTKLINSFTDMRPPETVHSFPEHSGTMGEFKVVGKADVDDVSLLVLESRGGHVPGNVFFFAPDQGLFFSGDYLIDVPSLSDRTKTTLSLARSLLTSTNVNSKMFVREMGDLKALMDETAAALAKKQGPPLRILPGHGEFYVWNV